MCLPQLYQNMWHLRVTTVALTERDSVQIVIVIVSPFSVFVVCDLCLYYRNKSQRFEYNESYHSSYVAPSTFMRISEVSGMVWLEKLLQ